MAALFYLRYLGLETVTQIDMQTAIRMCLYQLYFWQATRFF